MEKKNTDYINCDLSDLTLRQQTIIRMWIDGKNYREISEEFGCSKQNICATIKRIQKILDTPPDMRTKPAKKIAKPPKKRVKRAKSQINISCRRKILNIRIMIFQFCQKKND